MELILLLAILFPLTQWTKGIVIDKAECGERKFYCPDNCRVTYKADGCPHNCNCGSPRRCPLVTCPAKEPACAVYTQLDGCQSCACRLPYSLARKADSEDQGFTFVNRRTMVQFRRRLRDVPLNERNESKVRQIIRAQLCTVAFMKKVDNCLPDVINFSDVLRDKHSEGEIITLNPMMKTSREDLEKMCFLYRSALSCMKRNVFTVCRRTHPALAEIDAIYGYSCGPKQHIFLNHLECLQKAHVQSYRLAVCEDSAHRALRFIEESGLSLEEKQKEKCEALDWLIGCEKPTMMKRCSLEASIVNEESLISASQYVAPECHDDFRRNLFIRAAMNDDEDDSIEKNVIDNDNDDGDDEKSTLTNLVQQEPLKCTERQQKEISYNFRFLESDLQQRATTFSVAYPVVFSYSEEQLKQRCREYQQANANITTLAKRNCLRRNPQYSMVYFTLEYPCGRGTTENFRSHFNCLKAARKVEEVATCEKRAVRSLTDPSNDPCETYNILMQCMYNTVVMVCGLSGWETEYQYIAMVVKNTVPNCRVKRIIRNLKIKCREEHIVKLDITSVNWNTMESSCSEALMWDEARHMGSTCKYCLGK